MNPTANRTKQTNKHEIGPGIELNIYIHGP